MPLIRLVLLDEFLKDCQKPEDMLNDDGLLPQFTRAPSSAPTPAS